jgi:uncharacterized membrane protein
MNIGVWIHVVGGSVAIVSGYVAVFVKKGAAVHRRSGLLFVAAMVTMAVTGAVMAALNAELINVLASSVTTYLVLTALLTVRRPSDESRRLDLALMLMGLAVGAAGIGIGVWSLTNPVAGTEGVPPALPFIFGTVGLLSGLSDLRMLRPAGVRGVPRLRRHLWRMCLALFIAAGSFFLGQADELPASMRIFPLLAIPSFLPLLLMVFWLFRVRARKKPRSAAASVDALPLRVPAGAA